MKTNTNTKTDTSTTSYTQAINSNIQDGWRCPRCGKINAPWVRQCDCPSSITTYTTWDKITVNPCDNWWKHQITCDDNMFRIHPESNIYSDSINTMSGGSDYKCSVPGEWVNVPGTQTNSVKE